MFHDIVVGYSESQYDRELIEGIALDVYNTLI